MPRMTGVQPTRLLVLFPDPISPLIAKGEITDRYFNPGDLFDEVHLVTTCADSFPVEQIQRMAGQARLVCHQLETPPRFFWRTLGWQRALMGGWLAGARALGVRIQPRLIRCYGPHINALAGAAIRDATGARLVVSLHTRPDVYFTPSVVERWRMRAVERLYRRGLRLADRVVAIYKSQAPYLARVGIEKFDLAYNIINPKHIVRKTAYGLSGRARIVSVGRLLPGKAPTSLVRACADLDVELTIIGDGPLRQQLQEEARSCGLAERCRFIPSMANDEVCARLHEWDVFATHSDYPEIPKAVLEPFLVGMPIVINRPASDLVPEYEEAPCRVVEDRPDEYRSALAALLSDDRQREQLGRAAAEHAWRVWSPEMTERRYADIYREMMS